MRSLNFLPLSAQVNGRDRRYDLIYNSLMASPLPLRGSTERKLHASLVERLEAIGHPRPVLDLAGNPRPIRPDELQLYDCDPLGGYVDISDAEYDLVVRHVTATVEAEAFPKPWSREGQALLDYLASIK